IHWMIVCPYRTGVSGRRAASRPDKRRGRLIANRAGGPMHPLVTARPPRYGLGWPRLPRARRRLPRRDRDMPRTSEPGAIIDSGEPSHLPLREGRPVPATILPEDGLLRLGAVALPAGRRVHAPGNGTAPRPVAWVTATPVPDPGRVWSRLSDLSEQT